MICDSGTHCLGVNALDDGAKTVMVAMTDAAMAYLLEAAIILLLLNVVKGHLTCLIAVLCSRKESEYF